jgi:hypothetical protein
MHQHCRRYVSGHGAAAAAAAVAAAAQQAAVLAAVAALVAAGLAVLVCSTCQAMLLHGISRSPKCFSSQLT